MVSQTGAITAPPPEPAAAGISTSIEGINFDQAASNAGFYNIPPDPIGAAGPNHVVSVVNTSIEWHTKAGVQQLSQKLGTTSGGFFNPLSPVNGTFDPKVVYDPHAGRFVVVTLEKTDNGLPSPQPANTSRILVAVSDDSDPNGTWHFLSIDSKTTIGGIERWADYPGLAVDEDAIYITNNMFAFDGNARAFGGVRLWIVNKSPLYTGGAGTFTVHDPYASAGVEVTTQPAQILGTPPGGSTGTFLVSYSGLTSGTDDFLQIVRVDNPLTAPTFTQQFLNVGNIDTTAGFPDAPQSGTGNLIETNDSRAQNAVWRNNRLYTTASTMPVSGTNAGQVTARFWELNTTSLAFISQVQSGEIGGEDIAAGAYTFFPSIAANAAGDICVGFSASAPSIFPGAYAVVQLAGDAAGSVRPALTVAAGQDHYYRAFGGTRNRAGDYSGTCVDPSNDTDFWVFNEYAMTRGTVLGSYPTEDGRWATRWAKIDLVAPSVAVTPTGTTTTDSLINFTLTFSEPVTGLTAGGITVTNGTKGALSGSGTSYTLPVTASVPAVVTCQVNAGAASDSATNPNTASNTATVTRIKADPLVTVWPTASAITIGQTLADSNLTGGAATPVGTFAFTTPSTIPPVGTSPQSVTFTPTDTVNYNNVIGSVSVTANTPEIVVEQPLGTDLVDGSASIDFGSLDAGDNSGPVEFHVRNTGAGTLSGLLVTKDGAHAADFTVGSIGATSLAPGASTTFTVTFAPGAPGAKSAAIHLASDDADENPFDIALTGYGRAPVESWRFAEYGITDNTGNAANFANPDGDDYLNLMEYAFKLDTTLDDPYPLSREMVGNLVSITYPRNTAATDVTFTIQESDDLGDADPWSTATVTDQILGTVNGVDTVKATRTLLPGEDELFLRLKISLGP